jgi:hypothetical protein
MTSTSAPQQFEISLAELAGWASIALRVMQTADEDDGPIEPGSLLEYELVAIARVLADPWRLIPSWARERVCRMLAKVWPASIVGSIDEVMDRISTMYDFECNLATVRGLPETSGRDE